jgi:thiamine pyrophosphokinase
VRVMGGSSGGRVELSGTVGDYVSLLPLTERVTGVTTDGLRYALAGETLDPGSTRGLSKELASDRAAVSTGIGRLAVIHTRRTSDSSDA